MRSGAIPAFRDRRLAGIVGKNIINGKNELLKKPDTRSVQHESQVQSGCEAERYPRLGTGGSPAFGGVVNFG